MNKLKPILLVEDSSKDIELTLAALAESHVANPVIVMRDGLRRRADRRSEREHGSVKRCSASPAHTTVSPLPAEVRRSADLRRDWSR